MILLACVCVTTVLKNSYAKELGHEASTSASSLEHTKWSGGPSPCLSCLMDSHYLKSVLTG